ncbi:RNA polymerase sigma-70 factor [Tamlana sp. 2201CG12-4]|uniref:RNA polymerase sigma-70 factor n=1 Tax=Tamlana sp. 2201CG12-4 TaxID=3112582 RepID=UPI002DB95A04|nr:RNA polymerase sigma-70 factor [Tamlana sp. 2201CG12-4]MEC3907095.1 RNA polymerase sigma-70 factor [Tamlana sp. 2201CG12-4]
MAIPDDEIIQRLKSGDKKALTHLYDRYWKPLFISSYNLLKDKELCEEIIQDIFIDLWKKREDLKIRISLKSYLYACVRYKVFGEFRKKSIVRVELFENLNKRFQYATPETKMMHKELVEQIEYAVEMLPSKCKKVYKLSRDEQLSHKEIAEQLNISTKTVENHITNALRLLRTSLGNILSLEIISYISNLN